MKVNEEKMWEYCSDFAGVPRFLELILEDQESSRDGKKSCQATTYENLFPELSGGTGRFYWAKGSCREIFNSRLSY